MTCKWQLTNEVIEHTCDKGTQVITQKLLFEADRMKITIQPKVIIRGATQNLLENFDIVSSGVYIPSRLTQ